MLYYILHYGNRAGNTSFCYYFDDKRAEADSGSPDKKIQRHFENCIWNTGDAQGNRA